MPVPTRTRRTAPPLAVAWPHDVKRRALAAVRLVTVLHVVAAIGLLVLLCGVSEDWWVSAALGYLPRAPYLVFSLTILPALALRRWGAAAVNGLCGLLIAGPVMGLCVPLSPSGISAPVSDSMLIVSCNVQNGDSDLSKVFAELDALRPDVVAMQETVRGDDLLAAYFAGWHTIHEGEYWVASRYPVRLIDQCAAEAMGRTTAVVCEIDAPSGTWRLCDVHLSTARHGLTKLRWHSPLSGAGVDDLRWRQWERRLEAEETLRFIDAHADVPLIVAGDFNTPTSSSLFADVWGGWQSAFETAGWGYGYTSPCNSGRLWPRNTPWLRIDHILCDANWTIHAAGIGHSDGSDHRLVWSRVSLPLERERIQDSGVRIQDSGVRIPGQ